MGQLDIVPLGGLGEVGMNCLCIECGETRVVIDAGLTFPSQPFGTEVIHPDFSYLRDHPAADQAIILTHGHEDHVGALPFLLEHMAAPIYGPAYALAVAQERLAEFPPNLAPALHGISPGTRWRVGELTFQPFRVSHSIPDCTGLLIHSPVGTIVHTGDFRIDPEPPDGEVLDEIALARAGDQGVRLLLSDSTNVEQEQLPIGERNVQARLSHHVAQAKGRVVVSLFASNVYRLQALVELARAHHRKLVLMGRSVQTHARIASELGLLKGLDAIRISGQDARRTPPERLIAVATGSQGELRAALTRLARGTHPLLSLSPGDTVIHSARVIPGKHQEVYAIFDALARAGIRVVHRGDDPEIHASGHAARRDQRRMIELTRPHAFVPVHGTRHLLGRHAELAKGLGVPQVAVIENGQRLRVTDRALELAGTVPCGQVHRRAGQAVAPVVLRDRAIMAEVGLCVVVLVLDPHNRPLAPGRVFTRGVLREETAQPLLRQLADAAIAEVRQIAAGADDDTLTQAACRPVRRLLQETLGWKPPVHCLLQRVPARSSPPT